MLDYAVLAMCPIKEIVIPESVTEINNSAFYECTELERVILPESLTAIWEKAFRYCRSLKKIIVRSKVLEDLYCVPKGCEIINES